MITPPNPSRLSPLLGSAAAVAAGLLVCAGLANAQANVAILHNFVPPDGTVPVAGLIQASDGTFYGTTYGNTVFQMTPDGSSFTVVYRFSGPDGLSPSAGLIQTSDGTLYGTTIGGGDNSRGTIFGMAPDGSGFTVLHSFTGSDDGANPQAGLIQGSDGMLYGTTREGGSSNAGTVFQMAPDGSAFTVLHSFAGGTDGTFPQAGLIQGSDGTLYGTTSGYGPVIGTVFQIAPDGSTFTVLHTFSGTDGAVPLASLILAGDGMLYGTTYRGGSSSLGTIFQIGPDSSGFTVLHSFSGAPADGSFPSAGLIQTSDGTFYGTTSGGGAIQTGTVFQMTLSPGATARRWK